MKLKQRGFTLVELMIVISIIAILAVALFPSLTSYLKRGRDAARISNMKDITSALGAFYSDNERYPPSTALGCLSSGATALNTVYLPVFLMDPQNGRQNGCGANGVYGYAMGSGYTNSPQYLLTSIFEAEFGGNYDNSSGSQVNILSLVGTGQFTFTERTALDVAGVIRHGNGSGYLMFK